MTLNIHCMKHLYFLEVKMMLMSEICNQVVNKNNFVMSLSCEAIKSLCNGSLKPWKENVKLEML